MQSKTSFFNFNFSFNKTLFAKSVTRFWPVWGSYLVIWFILMPVVLLSSGPLTSSSWYVNQQNHILSFAKYGGTILGAVYGLFSAMAVWSFLYNARSAHGMACLPVTREGQFLSYALAGILPMLGVNVLIFLLSALAELFCGRLHLPSLLTWLAVVSMILLFFYAFATLCAQLTGSIVVLPLVYGVLNFTAIGVEELLRAVFAPFVYGLSSSWGYTTRYLSPVVGYFINLDSRSILEGPVTQSYRVVGWRFVGWGTVIGYAVMGLVLLALSMLLFRKRRMETAGDVVAVRILKPVFRWCMAMGFGLCFACLLYAIIFSYRTAERSTAFVSLLFFLLAGAVIGWFIADMLIKKSFRVFHTVRWAGLGACCGVIVVLMLAMRLDLFGVERYVPVISRVEEVTVWSQGERATFKTPEGIARAEEVHQEIIAHKQWNAWTGNAEDGNLLHCRILYTRTDGSIVNREYMLRYTADSNGEPVELHDAAPLQALMNTQEAIANRKEPSFPLTESNIQGGSISAAMTVSECVKAGGWKDPEEFLLREYMGIFEREMLALSSTERKNLVGQAVLDYAMNGYDLYYSFANAGILRAPGSDSDLNEAIEEDSYFNSRAVPRYDRGYDLEGFVEVLNWDAVWINYEVGLTPQEAARLYFDSVCPDLDAGTVGRVWLLTDENYLDTVYNARVDITARQRSDGQPEQYDGPTAEAVATAPAARDYSYSSFYTVPTVESTLTNAFLREKGLVLHTERETRNDLQR